MIGEEDAAAEANGRPLRSAAFGARLRLRVPQQGTLDTMNDKIRDLESQLTAAQGALEQLRQEHEHCPKAAGNL
jgi:hypothetical protein